MTGDPKLNHKTFETTLACGNFTVSFQLVTPFSHECFSMASNALTAIRSVRSESGSE